MLVVIRLLGAQDGALSLGPKPLNSWGIYGACWVFVWSRERLPVMLSLLKGTLAGQNERASGHLCVHPARSVCGLLGPTPEVSQKEASAAWAVSDGPSSGCDSVWKQERGGRSL